MPWVCNYGRSLLFNALKGLRRGFRHASPATQSPVLLSDTVAWPYCILDYIGLILTLVVSLGGGLWHPEAAPMAAMRRDIDRRPERAKAVLMDETIRKVSLP